MFRIADNTIVKVDKMHVFDLETLFYNADDVINGNITNNSLVTQQSTLFLGGGGWLYW